MHGRRETDGSGGGYGGAIRQYNVQLCTLNGWVRSIGVAQKPTTLCFLELCIPFVSSARGEFMPEVIFDKTEDSDEGCCTYMASHGVKFDEGPWRLGKRAGNPAFKVYTGIINSKRLNNTDDETTSCTTREVVLRFTKGVPLSLRLAVSDVLHHHRSPSLSQPSATSRRKPFRCAASDGVNSRKTLNLACIYGVVV